MDDLIWAAAVFLPLITLVLATLGPVRRAIAQWGAAHGMSAAERDAKAALDLADAEESRHELVIRSGSVAEETARAKAKLAMETAQFEADAEAARQCLPAAVEARRRALEARAEAEAALAPEVAGKSLEGTAGEEMAALSGAYAAYCASCGGTPWTFGQWIQGYQGASRA